MGTIADKLNKLAESKAEIKAAIIEKGQAVGDADTFASYAGKIAAIQTGVDTSDATAVAGDIASGKTAYVKGKKITGTSAARPVVYPEFSVKSGKIVSRILDADQGSNGTITVTINDDISYNDGLIIFPNFESTPIYSNDTINFLTVTAILVLPYGDSRNDYCCAMLGNFNNFYYANYEMYRSYGVARNGNTWTITVPDNYSTIRLPSNITTFECATFKLFK